ncbi:MAG: uroporphyrinogen-III synthase, partial [Actinomycetota bacterium]|nr:uroporphyrinogen-III synthase [Actinomycetota bacterium]
GRVLLPQAAASRPVLAEGLNAKGWEVEVVTAYRTLPAAPAPDVLAAAAKADAIAFTSASTVSNYLDAAGPEALPPVVVCIGPVTAEEARNRGVAVTAVAGSHTLEGLVETLALTLAKELPDSD